MGRVQRAESPVFSESGTMGRVHHPPEAPLPSWAVLARRAEVRRRRVLVPMLVLGPRAVQSSVFDVQCFRIVILPELVLNSSALPPPFSLPLSSSGLCPPATVVITGTSVLTPPPPALASTS